MQKSKKNQIAANKLTADFASRFSLILARILTCVSETALDKRLRCTNSKSLWQEYCTGQTFHLSKVWLLLLREEKRREWEGEGKGNIIIIIIFFKPSVLNSRRWLKIEKVLN